MATISGSAMQKEGVREIFLLLGFLDWSCCRSSGVSYYGDFFLAFLDTARERSVPLFYIFLLWLHMADMSPVVVIADPPLLKRYMYLSGTHGHSCCH